MKIILLQDLPKLGPKNSVITVSDGYARNALIPYGKAKQATPQELAHLEQKQASRATQRKVYESAKQGTLERLNGETILVHQKANEKGHLFASVTAKDIARHLAERGYEGIEPRDIQLKAPIKEAGEHTIKIAAGGSNAAIVVDVQGA